MARTEPNTAGNWRGKKVAAIVRFRSKILPQQNGCIFFDSSHDKDGYPKFSVGGDSVRAARFIFEYGTGEDLGPEDCVCHTCDEPRCVNFSHLWKGTVLLNNQDRDRKGRHTTHSRGGRHNAARGATGRFLPA